MKFLKQVEDNILVHVLMEPTRKGALPDFFFVNRELLVGKVVTGSCLDHRDHEVVEFQIVGGRRKNTRRNSTRYGESSLQVTEGAS